MTQFSRFIAILLCLITAQGVLANPRTVLVVGDSLSAAYGLEMRDGWVSLLQQRLQDQNANYRVINASITGDTTAGGLSRLPDALSRHQPSVVIIELGGNDGLRGLDLSLAGDNLKRMVEISQDRGARVLLLGVRLPANYGNPYRQRFSQMFEEVAEAKDIPLVPALMLGVADDLTLMQADGIHPGAAGQLQMLENVWPSLQPLL